MRSMGKIRRLLRAASVRTPAAADDAMFEAIKTAYIETRQNKPAPREPMRWSLMMRSTRTRLAVAAVVMLVGAVAVLLWQGTGSAVALADVLARLERIDAYTCEATTGRMSPEGGQSKSTTWVSRDYGTKAVIRNADTGEVSMEAYMLPKEKTAIMIQHDQKAYVRFEFDDRMADKLREEIPDAREMLVGIQNCSHTSLGRSFIDGVEVEGFRTTDPNYTKDTDQASRVEVTLWVDVKTRLPVQFEEDIERTNGTAIHRVSHDFQWDVPIDPTVFQPLIPDGYTNASAGSIQIPAMNDETAVQGLRLCVELNGQYPRALTEPALKSYMMYLPEVKGMKREEVLAYVRDPNHAGSLMQKMMPITALWMLHSTLASEQRDPAYYGDTVTPQSPHAVLLRWKLDDGRYRVIFGDLTTRDVSAEELAKLEAAPRSQQPGASSPQTGPSAAPSPAQNCGGHPAWGRRNTGSASARTRIP
jgi:hypothetical protein